MGGGYPSGTADVTSDAVYVDTVDEKAIVAIRPKPTFRPLIEIATTRAGSGVVLINQTPQTQVEPEASEWCSWRRRGRVELGLKHGLGVSVIGHTTANHVLGRTLIMDLSD